MIRAILDGRKTQTRRALKRPFLDVLPLNDGPGWIGLIQRGSPGTKAKGQAFRCRYGVPGDHLWVRETWQRVWERRDGQRFTEPDPNAHYVRSWYEYAATSDEPPPSWRPSIHMPRAASRLSLKVTQVRAERLQDISEADAIAEGVEPVGDAWKSYEIIHTGRHRGKPNPHAAVPNRSPVTSYRELWEAVNGPGSWDANPMVWAVSFERVKEGG
jgi:hypothetical protein